MKKTLLLFLVLGISQMAFAHDDTHDKAPQENAFQNAYVGVGGGVDLAGSSWNSASVTYGVGGLFDVFGGYQFDRSLAVQAEVQNVLAEATYATTNIISQYNLRGLIELKYTIDSPICQPYLLLGGGLVYSVLNQPAIQGLGYTTSVNADALAGLGLQTALSPNSHLFIEAKYNFILSSGTSLQDIPITAGIWTGF